MLRPKTTPPGHAAQQVGHRPRAPRATTSSALRSAGVRSPAVRQRLGDRLRRIASPTTSGRLGAARPVEVRRATGEAGEVGAQGLDVVHAAILPCLPGWCRDAGRGRGALRAAGCVYAEDEAAAIWSTYADPGDARRCRRRPRRRASAGAGGRLGRVRPGAGRAGARRLRPAATGRGDPGPRRRGLQPDARVVVDLGCGAGALAASLAVLLPDAGRARRRPGRGRPRLRAPYRRLRRPPGLVVVRPPGRARAAASTSPSPTCPTSRRRRLVGDPPRLPHARARTPPSTAGPTASTRCARARRRRPVARPGRGVRDVAGAAAGCGPGPRGAHGRRGRRRGGAPAVTS